MIKRNFCILLLFFIATSFILLKKEHPTAYIIGDSTVKNGDGTGKNDQWGWGNFISDYFDSTRIDIRNRAIGGRSSRTFITEGRWDSILVKLKPGDYVIMQFGHNDGGPLDDTARARGTICGIGNDSQQIYNPIRKINEVVFTYGHYMRKYIRDAKARKTIPIVCSPISRNDWKDGNVIRSFDTYSGWSKQIAEEEGAYFTDLNGLISIQYELMGDDKVKSFFPIDHTHTNKEGALLNAKIVVEQLRLMNPGKIKKFMHRKAVTTN